MGVLLGFLVYDLMVPEFTVPLALYVGMAAAVALVHGPDWYAVLGVIVRLYRWKRMVEVMAKNARAERFSTRQARSRYGIVRGNASDVSDREGR